MNSWIFAFLFSLERSVHETKTKNEHQSIYSINVRYISKWNVLEWAVQLLGNWICCKIKRKLCVVASIFTPIRFLCVGVRHGVWPVKMRLDGRLLLKNFWRENRSVPLKTHARQPGRQAGRSSCWSNALSWSDQSWRFSATWQSQLFAWRPVSWLLEASRTVTAVSGKSAETRSGAKEGPCGNEGYARPSSWLHCCLTRGTEKRVSILTSCKKVTVIVCR